MRQHKLFTEDEIGEREMKMMWEQAYEYILIRENERIDSSMIGI